MTDYKHTVIKPAVRSQTTAGLDRKYLITFISKLFWRFQLPVIRKSLQKSSELSLACILLPGYLRLGIIKRLLSTRHENDGKLRSYVPRAHEATVMVKLYVNNRDFSIP